MVPLPAAPGRMGCVPFPSGYFGLSCSVGAHDKDCFSPATLRTEGDESSVGGPARMFVASFAGEPGVAAAVGVDDINLETVPLLTTVNYTVTFG